MSDLGNWFDEAACLGQHELFDSTKQEDRKEAKAICADCPVRWECLQDALNRRETHAGTIGGVHELELRIVQSLNAKGETHVYPGRRIRCPYCGPRSTQYLTVAERFRTNTLLECSQCGLGWVTRKVISRRTNNF